MPKFLISASYTLEGVKGLLKEGGTSRRKAVEDTAKAMGGHLEAFYYTFGENDVFGIADMPDNVTAATFAMGLAARGTVHAKTTVLLTPEEVDQAVKKTMKFRAAGQ